jgi:hypothetical protein
MRRKLLRPVVELFNDGEILDVNDLHRRGAFSGPGMWFPFRKLKTKTFFDYIEINFRDRNRPPLILPVERTRLHLGGMRPWFICTCGRRCGRLYLTSIDARCRVCSDLQFASQRQRRKARLQTKAENIRSRLWRDGEKIIRPRYMHERTFRQHLHKLRLLQQAISTRSGRSSVRSFYRFRERDDEGRYCDEQADYEMN